MKKHTIEFLAAAVLTLGLTTGMALAQEATVSNEIQVTGAPTEVTLTAVPPRLGDDYSLVVKPGETVQTAIEVRNPSDYPATVETFARDFIIGEDGETPIAVEDEVSSKWSLAQWVTLTPTSTVLKPRGSATILVTIQVPADALPGGRYAMVLHKPATGAVSGETTGAQVTAQVGTLLYVVVDGATTEDAKIADFKFAPFSEFGPVDYSLKVQNNSTLHIRPELKVVVKNMFGKEVATLEPDQKNIFPDSEREYQGEWDVRWAFGRYTAVAEGVYGAASDKTLVAETSFWIVPVRAILAIVLVIVLIVLIVVTTKKKYQKMLDLEAEKVKKLDEKLQQARKEEKD